MMKPALVSALVLGVALPTAATAADLSVSPSEIHLSQTGRKSAEVTLRYAKRAADIGLERAGTCLGSGIVAVHPPSGSTRAPHEPYVLRVEAFHKTGTCVLEVFASTEATRPRMVDRGSVRITVTK